MSDHPYTEPLQAAVEAGTVTADTAKAILNWIGPDGGIKPPTERAAAIAREVLEAAGLEFRLAKGHGPTESSGETKRTGPGTVTPTADGSPDTPVSASSRASQRPQKRRSAPGRTEPPTSQPPTARAGDMVAQTTPPSPPRKSAVARSRAAATWATHAPSAAVQLLSEHAAVVLDLLAPDAAVAHGSEIEGLLESFALVEPEVAALERFAGVLPPARGDAVNNALRQLRDSERAGQQRLLDLLVQLPSSTEVSGEPLSVLAAARENLMPDQRATGMLPTPPRVHVAGRTNGRGRLPELPPTRERQLILPTLHAALAHRAQVGPAPWLTTFDRMGGESMARGVGAPLPLRLWVEALAWAPPAARFGRLVQVPLTVRDLRNALWPYGWQRARQLPRLRDAMRAVNALGFLAIPGTEIEWAPVLWRSLPRPGATLDTTVLLLVHLPPVQGSGHGARFDRPTLRKLGLRSAPVYRGYLGLVAEWDRKLSGGRRPYTPPQRGSPLPWPSYNPAERRRLIFGPDEVVGSRATLRKRQERADRAFRDLEDQGVIDIDRDDDPRRWRLIRRDL